MNKAVIKGLKTRTIGVMDLAASTTSEISSLCQGELAPVGMDNNTFQHSLAAQKKKEYCLTHDQSFNSTPGRLSSVYDVCEPLYYGGGVFY